MLQLLAADEWTLDFMASRPQDFACADYDAVVERLAGELAEGTRAAQLAQLLQRDESLTLDEQLSALCVRDPRYRAPAVCPLRGMRAILNATCSHRLPDPRVITRRTCLEAVHDRAPGLQCILR